MNEKNNAFRRIGRFFTLLTNRVYKAVSRGPIGRVMTAYPTANQALLESATVRTLCKRGKKGKHPLRRGMACAMDQSLLRRATRAGVNVLGRCSLRTIGLFLVTLGAYAAIVMWLLSSIWQEGEFDAFRLFVSLALSLVGVLLLFSDISLAQAMSRGYLSGFLLRAPLGISEEALKDIPLTGKQGFVYAVPLGMLFGALLAVVGPLYLFLALLAVLVTVTVFSIPEAGVVLLLLFAPFYALVPYGEAALALLAFLCIVGYLCKILRGTRFFRMEIQDVVVLGLVLTTLCNAVSAGQGILGETLGAALLIALYFPAVNMLATAQWIRRVRGAMLFSATCSALLAISQFIVATVVQLQETGAVQMTLLGAATKAGFSDNVAFSYFMVLTFPLALHGFIRANARLRLPAGFACVAIAAGIALSWVQSAWIALAAELVVLFLIYRRDTFPYFGLAALASPGIFFAIPAAWRVRLAFFIREQSDVSVQRMGTASKLTAQILFEGGSGFFGVGRGVQTLLFGLGRGGMEAVCALYTATPASEMTATFSFWLYRLLEGGVLGVLLPAALFFLLLQNCFSLFKGVKKSSQILAPLCGVLTVCGAICSSIFQYAWGDPAALLLFFLLISLMTADARNRRSAAQVLPQMLEQSASSAELEYRLSAAKSAAPDKEGVHESK